MLIICSFDTDHECHFIYLYIIYTSQISKFKKKKVGIDWAIFCQILPFDKSGSGLNYWRSTIFRYNCSQDQGDKWPTTLRHLWCSEILTAQNCILRFTSQNYFLKRTLLRPILSGCLPVMRFYCVILAAGIVTILKCPPHSQR